MLRRSAKRSLMEKKILPDIDLTLLPAQGNANNDKSNPLI